MNINNALLVSMSCYDPLSIINKPKRFINGWEYNFTLLINNVGFSILIDNCKTFIEVCCAIKFRLDNEFARFVDEAIKPIQPDGCQAV